MTEFHKLCNEFVNAVLLEFKDGEVSKSTTTLMAAKAVAQLRNQLLKEWNCNNCQELLTFSRLAAVNGAGETKLTEAGKCRAIILQEKGIPPLIPLNMKSVRIKEIQNMLTSNIEAVPNTALPSLQPPKPAIAPVIPPRAPIATNIYHCNTDAKHHTCLSQEQLSRIIVPNIVSLDILASGGNNTNEANPETPEGYSVAQIGAISSSSSGIQAVLMDMQVGGISIDQLLKRKLMENHIKGLIVFDSRQMIRLQQTFTNDFAVSGKFIIDAQLVYEYFTGNISGDFLSYLIWVGVELSEDELSQLRATAKTGWNRTSASLSNEQLHYAALRAVVLQRSLQPLLTKLSDRTDVESVDMMTVFAAATRLRIEHAFKYYPSKEQLFLYDRFTFAPISYELVMGYIESCPETALIGSKSDVFANPEDPPYNLREVYNNIKSEYLECKNSSKKLISIFPEKYSVGLHDDFINNHVCDIVIDKGRRPYYLLLKREKKYVFDDYRELVTESDLTDFCNKIDSPFGSDNRVGIEGELHRISCIRNKQDTIIGLTIRIGRYFRGNSYALSDLLFHENYKDKSILVLGPPGSGKTSLIREIARKLADVRNVMIVDTSNEISGDSDVTHTCVGKARRMMVGDVEDQHRVMIECVQNHTPEVLVVDEIGRTKEVNAAKTTKERGVRLIASAHGDFRKLLKNTDLRGLVGGVQSVQLGDSMAKATNNGRKTCAERIGDPIFDIIIQIEKNNYDTFYVIKDTMQAVDDILDGKKAQCEIRTRKANVYKSAADIVSASSSSAASFSSSSAARPLTRHELISQGIIDKDRPCSLDYLPIENMRNLGIFDDDRPKDMQEPKSQVISIYQSEI